MMRMKNVMRTGAVVVVFLTAIIGVVFSSKVALATTSADSTFSQLIREIDCSHIVYKASQEEILRAFDGKSSTNNMELSVVSRRIQSEDSDLDEIARQAAFAG